MSLLQISLTIYLVAVNFIFWLLGVLLVAIGCFLHISKYIQAILDPDTSELLIANSSYDENFTALSYALISTGLFFIFLSVIGSCGLRSRKKMLIFSIVLITLLISAEVTLLAVALKDKKKTVHFFDTYVSSFFKTGMITHRRSENKYELSPIGKAMADTQSYWNCCGYYNSSDFCIDTLEFDSQLIRPSSIFRFQK